VRKQNEDACGAFGPGDGLGDMYLFVVADGMGGHAHGREASVLARDATFDVFAESTEPVERRLRSALVEANHRVWDRAHASGHKETMGTTCTALALADGHAWVAHVGDSRAYRLHGTRMRQLTQDHTFVEDLRRNGTLTEEEARTHPRRNALTRVLGIAADVEVDLVEVGVLRKGDRFLLCSDGLGPLSADELAAVLEREEPEAACRRLVARAAEAGGTDNATAVAVYI